MLHVYIFYVFFWDVFIYTYASNSKIRHQSKSLHKVKYINKNGLDERNTAYTTFKLARQHQVMYNLQQLTRKILHSSFRFWPPATIRWSIWQVSKVKLVCMWGWGRGRGQEWWWYAGIDPYTLLALYRPCWRRWPNASEHITWITCSLAWCTRMQDQLDKQGNLVGYRRFRILCGIWEL